MATATQKSRVGNGAKKGGFKFTWWMAAILILLVAAVGILVLRYSRAATVRTWVGADSEWRLLDGQVPGNNYRATVPTLPTANKTVMKYMSYYIDESMALKQGDTIDICFYYPIYTGAGGIPSPEPNVTVSIVDVATGFVHGTKTVLVSTGITNQAAGYCAKGTNFTPGTRTYRYKLNGPTTEGSIWKLERSFNTATPTTVPSM